jgi:hypothetical protein
VVGKKLNLKERGPRKNDRDLVFAHVFSSRVKSILCSVLGGGESLLSLFLASSGGVQFVSAIFVDWEWLAAGMRLYCNPSELPQWSL